MIYQFLEGITRNRGPDFQHQILVVGQVVQRQKGVREDFLRYDQVAQIGAAELGAAETTATLVQGPDILAELGVSQVSLSFPRKDRCLAGVSGWHHAIEEVHAGGHGFAEVQGRAYTHQIARFVFREEGGRKAGRFDHFAMGFAHGKPANGVSVEFYAADGVGVLRSELLVYAALNDPE